MMILIVKRAVQSLTLPQTDGERTSGGVLMNLFEVLYLLIAASALTVQVMDMLHHKRK
jgi:hypothetical protein